MITICTEICGQVMCGLIPTGQAPIGGTTQRITAIGGISGGIQCGGIPGGVDGVMVPTGILLIITGDMEDIGIPTGDTMILIGVTGMGIIRHHRTNVGILPGMMDWSGIGRVLWE
jgi:hypothetical protein